MAKLDNDVAVLKSDMADIKPMVKTIHDTFLRGEGKINQLNKAIYGNGDPTAGLKHRVNELESQRDQVRGAVSFMKWAIGILGLGNIALIVKLFI